MPLTVSAVIAAGVHLFPFRTEKLSPLAPMVLGGQPPGRVGSRRFLERPRFARPFVFVRRFARNARPQSRRALVVAGRSSCPAAHALRVCPAVRSAYG